MLPPHAWLYAAGRHTPAGPEHTPVALHVSLWVHGSLSSQDAPVCRMKTSHRPMLQWTALTQPDGVPQSESWVQLPPLLGGLADDDNTWITPLELPFADEECAKELVLPPLLLVLMWLLLEALLWLVPDEDDAPADDDGMPPVLEPVAVFSGATQ